MTPAEYADWLRSLGFAPLPIRPDGSKAPIVKWSDYVDQPPAPVVVSAWFRQHDTDGVGVVCGASSGHLEMLEAEGRALHMVPQLAEAMAAAQLADLWARIATGWVELTPSGGLHWHYRLSDGPARPNTKLARRPATPEELAEKPSDRFKVMFETRVQRGFKVLAPSGGRTHPTGAPWQPLVGSPATCPSLTVEERDALYAVVSQLDELPPVEQQPGPVGRARQPGDPKRPGDDYNERASWQEILTPHGWTVARRLGGSCYGWRRPGKDDPGLSATTGRNDGDNLFVFSSSTQFEPETPYSKFGAYALLEHGGDHAAAASALAKAGYGDKEPISPTGDPFGSTLPPAPSTLPEQPQRHLYAVDGNTARVVEPLDAVRVVLAFGPTEDGVARSLAQLHHHTLRHCPQRGKWLRWNGAKWVWDDAGVHRELVKEIARAIPDSESATWRTFKRRALSAAGISGIARNAESDDRLTVHIDELDAHPYELNTPEGIVDLRTGQLMAPDPSKLHTRSTTATPDFERVPAILPGFLATTFGGDAALIGYVQRLFGISAIGTVLEQILLFQHGQGANGKSTLTEAVMHALGTGTGGYAIAANSEMLMQRRHSEHPAELAQLAGARMVVCTELDEGQKFAEAKIKMLTGRDSINARFMYGSPFTFQPSHTLWLLGNHKPDATAGGPAFWRRVQLVPFEHVVPEGNRDPRLGEKLAQEAPAILAWLARGAADYHRGGLQPPGAVREATAAYAEDQDTVGRFVAEQCHLAPGSADLTAPVAAVTAAYEKWCREEGAAPVSVRRFTQTLRDRFGVEPVKLHGGKRAYRGLGLATGSEGPDPFRRGS